MNVELLQGIIDVVFKGNMLYLSPLLLILMTFLFADNLITLFYNAMDNRSGRRNRRSY